MKKWQKIAFPIVLVILVALIIIFWGTIFSGVMLYCLVMALPVYLYNRYINVDREQEFSDEDSY